MNPAEAPSYGSVWRFGSDALLLLRSATITSPDKAGSQQVETASTEHLALDPLQLRVLSLCLAIRPWFDQCRLHRAVVLRNAGSERSHQTLLRISRSFVKPFKLLMFDETMEAAEHISRRRQICIAAPIIAIVRAIAFETGAVPDGMRPVAPGTTMCSVHLSQSALQHGVSRLRPHRSRTGRQF